MKYEERIAGELNVKPQQVSATINLLDGGATVPFISRYRKEITGSLDDLQVTGIRDRIIQLRDLDARKEVILKSIQDQEKLTPDLEDKIRKAETMSALEDLYLPYRPKRKTRASVAKEKGLEALAKTLFDQNTNNVEELAARFINDEKGVSDTKDALTGARDIIAEWINEDAEVRKSIRQLFIKSGVISSKVLKSKKDAAAKYKDYFEWSEPIQKIPSHRLLAIRRGANESLLTFSIAPEEEDAISIIERKILTGSNEASAQVNLAIKDCYKRLMSVSMETEIRLETKKRADEEAIQVFMENLKQLLMAAPLGQVAVMAVDPGFRTGCKVVCLDKQGKLLEFKTIYPNEPQKDIHGSGETIKYLASKHSIKAIAIGNGTASRETENFIKKLELASDVLIAMVNENGASIYSASEVARDEFPNEDVTVRGSVSIGRRLMDPLAELVKIDAKSIGVGQYQHDVDQAALKHSLDDVVMSCVNNVGVELNTSSKQLLTYVSGLGPQIAENIVKYRDVNGPFTSRVALKKVPRLGDKAFEQSAGFLRIRNATNPLDSSAVHPERYATVKQMASDINASVEDLMKCSDLRSKLDIKKYVTSEIGLPTLTDIVEELDKPGRDPRDHFEAIQFQEGVNEMSDLKTGMTLPGVITNITKFGAFVDIGVHQDGLVHISHLSDSYVSDPSQVVKLGQKVSVKVLEVDIDRKRISLSMKSDCPQPKKAQTKRNQPRSIDKTKPNSKPKREEKLLDGDLQAKLNMLKGKWGS